MLKYDMHVHSFEGSACSSAHTADMVAYYKQKGFAGFVLTNHFRHGSTRIDRSLPWAEYVNQYVKAYEAGLKKAKELDFDLLFGIEENYGGGRECLIYGVTPQFLYGHPELENNDMDLWCNAVHSVGGVICYAHPFRHRSYILPPKEQVTCPLIDGAEAYNFCNTPEENEKAYRLFTGLGQIVIAGGDQHHVDFTNTYGIAVEHRIPDAVTLANILRNREHDLYLGK